MATSTDLPTFERDDRKHVIMLGDALTTVLGMSESLLIQEHYGLSVTFDEAQIEWTAVDPREHYKGVGNTPSAAILTWDFLREQGEKSADDDGS